MFQNNYRWVIVAAGGLLGCVAIGTMFSLPVFLLPISQDTGWSRTGISTAMTIAFLAMAIGGFAWGSLVDRIGPRIVVLMGSVLLPISVVLAGRATSLWEFQLTFGVLVGGATAAILAPMMATVTTWFDTHRSLAVSLVSAGFGMAPMTMSPLTGYLVGQYNWRVVFLIMAGLAAAIMIPTSFLVRRAPVTAAKGCSPGAANGDQDSMTVADALRSPQFIILALTYFLCCATHSGPIFHTVSYAITCGVAPMTAVTIYSVEGFAGLVGRLAFGLMGDRFGAKRVLVGGLLIQAFGALAYFFVRDLGEFYAVATLFGFTYAGVMPLYAVLARENFPVRMMGTVIGASTMASSLGMATGPFAGGWIFDSYATYGLLYLASFGIGIGATLIAIAYRPMVSDGGHAAAA